MALNLLNDTIAAITTPLGTGGVGAVRISGDKALETAGKIFSSSLNNKILPEFKANRIYHGWVFDNNNLVDEVILLVFKAPKSFTGENIVEIQCHGGINVVKNILKLVLKNGARLAERGEFTKRAFLNGKMDLSQAEAVLDLINSKTDRFSQVSAYNLTGKLSENVNNIRSELLHIVSEITAAVDFPEDVEEPDYEYIKNKILDTILKIESILNRSKNSDYLRNGIKITLAGRPNVGKSSLFNVLLNADRAIVTDIPGTTRDTISETIDINGIPAVLTDTAGIRELENQTGNNYVESLGINISKSSIKEADVVIFLFSLAEGLTEEDKLILEEIQEKPIIKLGTKSDLMSQCQLDFEYLPISSKTLNGIDSLKDQIEQTVLHEKIEGNLEFSTNTRQKECLTRAKDSLMLAFDAAEFGQIQDLILIDLKTALISLGEITGEIISDEILNNIFDNFCIGK
ncbi:MAG: tRNA uridine-5-carboxymethylaminomethyl(34) synthesis GTPase MnmE [bacterium]